MQVATYVCGCINNSNIVSDRQRGPQRSDYPSQDQVEGPSPLVVVRSSQMLVLGGYLGDKNKDNNNYINTLIVFFFQMSRLFGMMIELNLHYKCSSIRVCPGFCLTCNRFLSYLFWGIYYLFIPNYFPRMRTRICQLLQYNFKKYR